MEKMYKKNLVEIEIPAEKAENVDELVRMGYYGGDVIYDIIRLRATQLRPRRWFVKAEGGNII
ncbi:MAG: hypothetical protein U9N01_00630 [Euryarchaeota archaeon]|nr:hypothetical protein [Euryarchaeota archaeon]